MLTLHASIEIQPSRLYDIVIFFNTIGGRETKIMVDRLRKREKERKREEKRAGGGERGYKEGEIKIVIGREINKERERKK